MNNKIIKITLITLLILTLVFTACGGPKIICSDGTEVDDASKCIVNTNSVQGPDSNTLDTINNIVSSEPIEESDVIPYFVFDTFEYQARVTEPKDTIIKNANKVYQMFGELTYDFTNGNLLNGKKVYMKIGSVHMDEKKNREIYTGELKSGTNTIKLDAEITYISENPKYKFCFDTKSDFDMYDDDAICVNKGFKGPEPVMDLELNTLNFNFNLESEGAWIKETQKTTIENTGNVGQTFYVYVEDCDILDIIPQYEKVFIEAGDSKTLTINVNYLDNGVMKSSITKNIYIYMIPNNCDEISMNCAESADFSKKLVVNINK